MEPKHMNLVKLPNASSKVYKDECVYSYDNPETDTGLYVNLTSYLAFGQSYIEGYAKKTGNEVFLHIQRVKREIVSPTAAASAATGTTEPSNAVQGEGPEKKITRLAIGVEGGYDPDAGKPKFEYDDKYEVVIVPKYQKFPYPSDDLPLMVSETVKAIISAESATLRMEKDSMTGTWDGETRIVSKYATDLKQLDNGIKIPPSNWKCEQCDLTNNLWLNLTDGSILCGRKFFDGSGGNDHAVKHYQECQYPLAVKLGTITPDGKGDVYSYAEDDMVEDPYLIKHLAHFGIKTQQLEKTEKSMVELEIDLNQRIGEWSILTESSSKLEPICGPGYTGMTNLGNSCYLNSVMQVIFIIPDFIQRFYEKSDEIFATYPADPANDFNVQMAKLAVGLLSGKYSKVTENSLDSDACGISPIMFKNIIGKNHLDFSSKHQQDAQEYFLHLIDILEKHSRHQTVNPANAVRFTVEDRFECMASGKVKYLSRDEFCLPLSIPLHLANNLDEVHAYEKRLEDAGKKGEKLEPDSLVRPRISLLDCLEQFIQSEMVEQFYSSAINDKTTAKKTTRLATMPDYLFLQLKKFTLREDWTSVKLDVAVDIPDILELNQLRATGLQPHEELLPELTTKVPSPVMDPVVLQQLAEMGFPPESCKRAVFFTKNTGVDAATQWIMEHIGDSDFNYPFVPPGTDISTNTAAADASAFVPNPNDVECITSMGFTVQQATRALRETQNNVERAADWIFSHQMEIDNMEIDEAIESSAAAAVSSAPLAAGNSGDVAAGDIAGTNKLRDGNSKYKLVAFISHMGTSSQVGHYVCHILKDNHWVIFNDSKVAISQNPPKELGYLYLYQRL